MEGPASHLTTAFASKDLLGRDARQVRVHFISTPTSLLKSSSDVSGKRQRGEITLEKVLNRKVVPSLSWHIQALVQKGSNNLYFVGLSLL